MEIRMLKLIWGGILLTEVRLADSPIDHGELQGSAEHKEYGQEAINTETFLTRPIIEESSHEVAL